MPPALLLPAAILGAGALGAGASIFSATQANKAANAQVAAQQAALAQQQNLFNTGLDTARQASSPFINFGQSMISPLTSLLTPGPDQTKTLEQLPGYQFNLSQGEKAVTNQATMTGLSGNAIRGGVDYASGQAGNTFSSLVNQLLQATGVGSNSASNFGNSVLQASGQAANTQGNSIANVGNAQAAGDIGVANAVQGGANAIGSSVNSLANLSAINALSGNKLFQGTGNMYANSNSQYNPPPTG